MSNLLLDHYVMSNVNIKYYKLYTRHMHNVYCDAV